MRRTEIRVEPVERFFARGRRMAELADGGKRIPPSQLIAFEDPADLLHLLTGKRVLLLRR